jgi:DNA-binding GntR family transcriptional regulator
MGMKSAAEIGSMENESGEPLALRGDGELPKSVVSLLEKDIVLGLNHLWERLIEDELLRRFAAKRHVVRRALADLQQMGIVEWAPNRGAMARAYREEEIQQLYVLRNLWEGHALIPTPLPEPDIEQLKAAQAVHDRAIASGDLGSVFHANVDFHERLCDQHLLASRQCYEKAAGIRWRSGMESAADAGQERPEPVACPA